jgi:hypothetical protein
VSIATHFEESLSVNMTRFLFVFHPNLSFYQFWAYSVTELADVRIASSCATGAFLTRLLPFYPEAVNRFFSRVAFLTTIDVMSSTVIASSFRLVSKCVAHAFLAGMRCLDLFFTTSHRPARRSLRRFRSTFRS